MFESVLFPAPFSPSSACTSPTAASKSTASFATTPGNRFVIPRMATAATLSSARKTGIRGADPGRVKIPEGVRFAAALRALAYLVGVLAGKPKAFPR